MERHQPFSKAGQCGIEVKGICAVDKLPTSAAVDTWTFVESCFTSALFFSCLRPMGVFEDINIGAGVNFSESPRLVKAMTTTA